MLRRNLRQLVVASVFMAGLLVGGAQPAAAEGLGWKAALDWFTSLWEAPGLFQPRSAVDAVQGGEGIPPSTPTVDCGPEVDPNGSPRPQCGAGV